MHNLRRKQAFEEKKLKRSSRFRNFEVFQLQVGGFDNNFSYLIVAEDMEAAIVDPCGSYQAISNAVSNIPTLFMRYILLTHGHKDHCSSLYDLKRHFPSTPVCAHPNCAIEHDIDLSDYGQLEFGNGYIECIFTPGHTNDSVCFHLSDDSALITGDTLFIDCCGYCEPQTMFNSLRSKILTLPDSNIIYSGHDYGRKKFASLGEERLSNPYLRADNFTDFCRELEKL